MLYVLGELVGGQFVTTRSDTNRLLHYQAFAASKSG